MKWLREYWPVAAIIFLVVYFVWLRPNRGPNTKEVIAGFDAEREEIEKHRAEWEARRAEFDAKNAQLMTDATLRSLRLLGEEYRFHLNYEKRPPQATDIADAESLWKSQRDLQPFVIVWGVDPSKLSDKGRGMLLAWEATGDKDGKRCVLMADAQTTKTVTAAEFEALRKATPAVKAKN
jgi:hypothetical protein